MPRGWRNTPHLLSFRPVNLPRGAELETKGWDVCLNVPFPERKRLCDLKTPWK